MTDSVDEKRRRAAHATANSAPKILDDAVAMRAGLDFRNDFPGVQSQFHRELRDVLVVQRILILEKNIMHFPKASGSVGGFRGFGCMFGMRMNIGQWKIAKDKTQSVPQR